MKAQTNRVIALALILVLALSVCAAVSPTAAAGATASAGYKTFTSKAGGFKITFPSKYPYEANEKTPVKIYIYLNPKNPNTGVNVATQAVTKDATLDSLMTYYTNQLMNYKQVTYILKPANCWLAGQPCKTVIYKAVVPVQYKTGTRDTLLLAQQTWIIHNGKAYLVTYKAPPSEYKQFQVETKNIISTFTLT